MFIIKEHQVPESSFSNQAAFVSVARFRVERTLHTFMFKGTSPLPSANKLVKKSIRAR